MKKKIFNWLFVLVMLPCMFFVNGCGKDDDSGEKELVTDYTGVNEVLASLNSKKNNLKQFKMTGNYVRTETDIEDDEKEESSGKISGSFDYDNDKYALKVYDELGNYVVDYVVKKDASSYTHYKKQHNNQNDRYYYYNVGRDYVSNEMVYYNQAGIDINRLDFSNYENLKNSYLSLAKDSLGFYVRTYDYNYTLNPTITLYKENGVYTLEYKVEIDTFEYLRIKDMKFSASLSFDGNSTFQVKYHYELLDRVWFSTYDLELNYSSGVDSSLYLTDLSPFENEGSEEVNRFRITPIIDGYADFDNQVINTNASYSSEEEFVFNYPTNDNIVIDGWYLDPEYTVSVDTLSEYPSYDMVLYAKTRPVDGYSLVIVSEYTNYSNLVKKYNPKWVAIPAGTEFDITDYANYDTIEVKVNGNSYTEDTFTVENQKVYHVYIMEQGSNSGSGQTGVIG